MTANRIDAPEIETPEPPALGLPLDLRGWFKLTKLDVGQGWTLDFVDVGVLYTPSADKPGPVFLWLSWDGVEIHHHIRPEAASRRLRRTVEVLRSRIASWRQFNHGALPEARLRRWLRESRLYPIERRPSAEEV